MEFHQIRYFIAVAKREHMGQAALDLAISQSALSHSIAALEEELNVQLFNRERRRIFLNEEGRLFLTHATKILGDLAVATEELKCRKGKVHGYLKIAAPISIGIEIVGPAWAKLRSKYPGIQAEIHSLKSVEIIEKVISGELNLGFTFGAQAHPMLESKVLTKSKLLIVTHEKYKLGSIKTKKEAIEKLAHLSAGLPNTLLGFGSSTSHPFFKRTKIQPKVDFLYDNYELAIQYLMKNQAWILLPEWILSKPIAKNLVSILREDIYEPFEISVTYPKNQHLTQSATLMLDECKDQVTALW